MRLLLGIIAFVCFAEIGPAGSPLTRTFEMGMIFWPPLGEATERNAIERGVGLTVEGSDHLLVQLPWSPTRPEVAGRANWIASIARGHGRRLTIAVDWMEATRDLVLGGRAAPWRFSDRSTRERFVEAVEEAAKRHQPEYFILGVEVNYYAFANPEDFREFVGAYRAAPERIRAASPRTRCLVTFQYELLSGRDVERGAKGDSGPVRAFGPDLDLLGIATYPHLAGLKPGDVSAAYFHQLAALDRPFGIFETSWPSSGPWTEVDQDVYLRRILEVCDRRSARLLIWTATTDTAGIPEVGGDRRAFEAEAGWMRSLGLWRLDGGRKTVVTTWKEWHSRAMRRG